MPKEKPESPNPKSEYDREVEAAERVIGEGKEPDLDKLGIGPGDTISAAEHIRKIKDPSLDLPHLTPKARASGEAYIRQNAVYPLEAGAESKDQNSDSASRV